MINGPARSIRTLLVVVLDEGGIVMSSNPASSTMQRPRRQKFHLTNDRNICENKPRLQFELIRDIHFQSLYWSFWTRPGSGRTSRPSCRAIKPLEPLKRLRPYSFKYNFLQSSLSPANLAHFLLTDCVKQRSFQERCEKIWRMSSSYRNLSKLKGDLKEDLVGAVRRFAGGRMSGE
jgi:hypothetical protein